MISAELGKPLESYVQHLVETGRYGSKSEVLREGVRLVEEREKRLAALDMALERGLADIDAGRTHLVEDVAGLCCTNRVMAAAPLSPDRLIPQLP